MRINTVRIVGAVAGLLISVTPLCGQVAVTTPAASAEEPMRLSPDLAEVVKLVQAGKSKEEIITQVKTCPRMYSLTATDAVNLDKFKVPQPVVLAMVEHDRALAEQDYTAYPAVKETTGTATRSTPAAAGKATKSIQLAPDSDVSRPKGNPPELARQPKKTWTSSLVVEQAPPAPKLELVPKEPGSGYVWIRGHWAWTGTWTWEEGYWVQRPGPDIQWMDGFWARHGKGWIWMAGHWR
jgi:hypothetical protein